MGILRLGKAGGFLALALLSLFVFTLNISFSQPILEVTVTGNTPVNQCTSNDYVITVSNTSTTEQASNVIVVATIPAGFRIDSAGGGTVVGQTITWNVSIIDPSSSWSSTITLFITCDRTTVSGQILVNVTQPVSTQGSLYVTVQPGAITITKTPEVIPASIGDTVHWTLTITSTGFGPVENVVVFDTLGPGLQFDAVQSTPGNTSGLPTVRWDKTNISALATMDPKAQVKIEVYVKVIACSGLENNADANWSCDGNSPWCETESAKASVQLILKEPVINYTLPNFQLDYCSSGTQFTIPITNSGTGVAHDFYLYVNRSSNGFDGLAVNVISPSGATYEPANNRFFLGDIPIGETDLIFTLTASNWCGPLPSGSLLFEPEYTDDCGELFKPPIKLSSYSVTGAPSLSVSKSGGPSEIFLGQPITYTITATYSGPLTCGTPPAPAGIITVVDTIPAGFTITTAGNGSGGEIPIVGANTITWTVNPATTTWPWSAQITLQTPGYGQCETYCYTEATNNVTASMTDCCGCNLSADSSQTTALQCEEYFTSSKTATSSSNFEKCKEITYTNTYTFADDNWWNGVPWTQFKFFEQMANAQTYVDNSLSITVNGTAVTGITPFFNDPLHPGWMALDFSTFPADPVRGSTLVITYNLLTGDASQPACEGSYSFYDWSILDTGKTGGQCQADQQIQETVYVTVNQSQMAISIDGIPSLIDDCDRYDVTIHVTRTSVVGAYDVFVEIPRQNYDITVTNTNPAPVSIDNSDPNWIRLYYGDMFTTLSSAQIDATVEKRCGTQPDVSSTVYWDGYCWDDNNYDKKCSATSGGHPILLRANLFIKKTPELIYATTNQVTWKIYVTNSGSGNAHNVWVEDVLDSDYRYFSSSVTDLGGNPVVVTTNANHDHNGNSINGVTWTMFEIPAGETRIITLTADIIGCTHLNNDVTTSWGCLNENCATPVSDHSMGAIPPANAVTTNTIPTSIDLCERKTVRVDVKNAGLTTVYDAEVEVFLPPGLTYVIGSGNPSDPENTSATPLKWTKTQVSALAALAPAGQTGDTVSIYFDIIANCTFPSGNRTIISQVRYKTVCAEVKLSPESRSTLPVRTPTVRIIKDGRNVTKNIPPAGSYADTVTAEPGDVVEWRLRISNTGTADAHHMEFWDVLPSNMTFSSISPAPPGGGSGTQASPWIYGDLAAGIGDILCSSHSQS